MKTFEDIPLPNNIIFPKTCQLTPGFNEEFEKMLAFWEFHLLSQKDLVKRGAYFKSVNGEQTFHSIICNATKKTLTKNRSKRSYEYFKKRIFSTGYSTHGLFPYRGKFHPQMIKSILNITGVKNSEMVLDPMCGSGTLNVEASLIGINSIGIDKNPFAAFMSRVKTESLTLDRKKLMEEKNNYQKYLSLFSEKSFNFEELMDNENDDAKVTRLFLLSYLDAMGFSRRVKAPISKLFPKVYQRYLDQIINFLTIKKRLRLQIGQSNIVNNSALNLTSISSESIDGIITSPPYSFAIDYIHNDKPQLEYLGYDISNLKSDMIGLQGNSKNEKIGKYFNDMSKIIEELSRVLKPNKFLTIVIGSNTRQTGGIKLENNIISSVEDNKLRLSRDLEKSIKGINNTMKKEHILIFKKEVNEHE